ncbi:hypothetical protein RB195_013860 [Necator americanus]|uniref:Ubiquinone biosynthesis monooxygenase COQ6, mitochondrial n=1 Tax=Necator americanus TaxID=51031 RepID=A0ABR1DXH9_NECAM
MNAITLPYNSNDAHIWTHKDPDLQLIEPRILASINRNYLVYGRKVGRPSLNHQVTIVNHGEHPIAFKVMTTDNYAYFVNQVFGIIPGRHLHALPHVRAPNQFTLQVNRRPYNCFCDEQQPSHWNTPRKDKLFILLASVFSYSIPPAAVFQHQGAYEKLRIYVSLIFKRFRGWCTWDLEKKKEGSCEPLGMKKEEAKNMIMNRECRIPLTFEEIPEPPPMELSKKKKTSKKDKHKAKIADVKMHSFPALPVETQLPSERRRKFTGKLGKGSMRDDKPAISLTAHVQNEVSKIIVPSKSARRDISGDIPKKLATTESVNKTARTQASKLDLEGSQHRKPSSERHKLGKSTMKDLKNLISLKSQMIHSKTSALVKSAEGRKPSPSQVNIALLSIHYCSLFKFIFTLPIFHRVALRVTVVVARSLYVVVPLRSSNTAAITRVQSSSVSKEVRLDHSSEGEVLEFANLGQKSANCMLLGYRCCNFGAVRYASSSQYYDAVVVGGGMVGNAMACAMGQNPKLKSKRILLLESGRSTSLPKTPPEDYSNRVSAVGPASAHLFRKLGVWDRLRGYRVKKVNRLRVIDNCSRAKLEFDSPIRDQEVAYIIENNVIIGALYDKVKDACPSVEIRTGVTVKKCSVPSTLNEIATIELDNSEKIETSLVIGADGARSKIRQAMNVDYTAFNYDQCGVVATLVVETPGENDVAWQRFCRTGPIAYLPLTRTLSSLVWTTSSDDAQRLLTLTKDEFVDELNHSMFTEEDQNDCVNKSLFALSRLPLISREHGPTPQPPHVVSLQGDTRALFPLGFGHAHTYVHPRAVLIGDAAHRIHPLAGQGVNLGWHDVMVLNSVLSRAVTDGGDIGSVTYLRDFDSQAQRHNLPVMVSCDWLNRLYRTNAAPVVMIRSLGLAAFNRLTPLKDFLVNRLSTPV